MNEFTHSLPFRMQETRLRDLQGHSATPRNLHYPKPTSSWMPAEPHMTEAAVQAMRILTWEPNLPLKSRGFNLSYKTRTQITD